MAEFEGWLRDGLGDAASGLGASGSLRPEVDRRVRRDRRRRAVAAAVPAVALLAAAPFVVSALDRDGASETVLGAPTADLDESSSPASGQAGGGVEEAERHMAADDITDSAALTGDAASEFDVGAEVAAPAVPGESAGLCGFDDADAAPPADLELYLGRTEAEAADLALAEDRELQVLCRDGEPVLVPPPILDFSWIFAAVVDDVVVQISVPECDLPSCPGG